MMIHSGECEDVVGRKTITTKWLCEEGMTVLDPYNSVEYGKNCKVRENSKCVTWSVSLRISLLAVTKKNVNFLPYGCGWDSHSGSGTSDVSVNMKQNATLKCSSNLPCVCFIPSTAPDQITCSNSVGSSVNSVICKCGESVCNAGSFCQASLSKCGLQLPCTNTNGNKYNNVDCTCGTSDCTSATGWYCVSALNRCSPVENDRFVIIESGKCTDLKGGKVIEDKSICEVASLIEWTKKLNEGSTPGYDPPDANSNVPVIQATSQGSSIRPTGCVFVSSGSVDLLHNTYV